MAAGDAAGRPLVFLLEDVPGRLAAHGDLWSRDEHPGQPLPAPD